MSASVLLSEEEFLELPGKPGKQELVDGELIELPPARYSHDKLGNRNADLLRTVLRSSRVWVESGYRLSSRTWLQPDVSVSWPDGADEVWIIYPKTGTMLVSRPDASQHNAADADYRCDLIGITITPAYRTPAR